MKLFQSALEKFETLGVSPNRSRLNGKLLTAVITYWFDCTLHCTYLVREVNSFSEFADTIFMIFTTTLVSTCFTIFIFNKTEIFRLVDDGEKMTEQGKMFKLFLKCSNLKLISKLFSVKNESSIKKYD